MSTQGTSQPTAMVSIADRKYEDTQNGIENSPYQTTTIVVANSDLTSQQAGMAFWRKITTVVILLIVNLLNYMDRYTIAGTQTYKEALGY